MRSFSIFSTLAVAALATFARAIPISVRQVTGEIGSTVYGVVTDVEGIVGEVGQEIEGVVGDVLRREECFSVIAPECYFQRATNAPSVAAVLANLESEIENPLEILTYLTSANVTDIVVGDALSAIEQSVMSAVDLLQQLVGQDASVIMSSVDGSIVLSVRDLVTIVADVIVPILSAISNVIRLAISEATVVASIATLLTGLGNLLNILATLVGGLIAALAPFLAPVLTAVFGLLSDTDLFNSLGLANIVVILGLTL